MVVIARFTQTSLAKDFDLLSIIKKSKTLKKKINNKKKKINNKKKKIIIKITTPKRIIFRAS